jgi:hypothetical protein
MPVAASPLNSENLARLKHRAEKRTPQARGGTEDQDLAAMARCEGSYDYREYSSDALNGKHEHHSSVMSTSRTSMPSVERTRPLLASCGDAAASSHACTKTYESAVEDDHDMSGEGSEWPHIVATSHITTSAVAAATHAQHERAVWDVGTSSSFTSHRGELVGATTAADMDECVHPRFDRSCLCLTPVIRRLRACVTASPHSPPPPPHCAPFIGCV